MYPLSSLSFLVRCCTTPPLLLCYQFLDTLWSRRANGLHVQQHTGFSNEWPCCVKMLGQLPTGCRHAAYRGTGETTEQALSRSMVIYKPRRIFRQWFMTVLSCHPLFLLPVCAVHV